MSLARRSYKMINHGGRELQMLYSESPEAPKIYGFREQVRIVGDDFGSGYPKSFINEWEAHSVYRHLTITNRLSNKEEDFLICGMKLKPNGENDGWVYSEFWSKKCVVIKSSRNDQGDRDFEIIADQQNIKDVIWQLERNRHGELLAAISEFIESHKKVRDRVEYLDWWEDGKVSFISLYLYGTRFFVSEELWTSKYRDGAQDALCIMKTDKEEYLFGYIKSRLESSEWVHSIDGVDTSLERIKKKYNLNKAMGLRY